MPYDYPCQTPGSHFAGAHCPTCQAANCDSIIKAEWGGTTEPQIVYELFFSPTAVVKWTSYMGRWKAPLLYVGVFIHQRPFCRFNKYGSSAITVTSAASTYHCEIGDLLIVFTDKPARRRVAILLQAKMAGGAWPPVPPADQWELYTKWPTFRYNPRSPTGGPGHRLCTQPFHGSDDWAGEYAELDDPAQTVHTTEALSTQAYKSFDDIVDGLLNGGAGRTFSYLQTATANDWDVLIWDLLTHTYACAVPASVTSGGTGTRGVGAFLEQYPWVDTTNGHGPGLEPPLGVGPDDAWGIPILHLLRENS
jgi:hypothetical protein